MHHLILPYKVLIKLATKKHHFFVFNFEELQMATLPDIACIELFTATQCLILHWLTFLTETAKHKLGQPKQQYEMQFAKKLLLINAVVQGGKSLAHSELV